MILILCEFYRAVCSCRLLFDTVHDTLPYGILRLPVSLIGYLIRVVLIKLDSPLEEHRDLTFMELLHSLLSATPADFLDSA